MSDTHLYYYRCRHCTTYLRTVSHVGKYARCNGCAGWMLFQFSEPITTDAQRAAAAKGRTYGCDGGLTDPWECKRCGETMAPQASKYYPMAGGSVPCCKACKDAQGEPTPEPPPRVSEREIYDRQEAAYAALEKKS